MAMMAVLCMSACGGTSEHNKEDGKIKIVTTIFPEYDWVKAVMGDKAEGADITLLLDNGVDLHSYQPTAEDILKISTCDMFSGCGCWMWKNGSDGSNSFPCAAYQSTMPSLNFSSRPLQPCELHHCAPTKR